MPELNREALGRLEDIARLPETRILAECTPEPVYLVGGSVRDAILGRPVHDLDFVVRDDLEVVAKRAGARFGARAVLLGREPTLTFRIDAGPLVLDLCPVEGTDLETDLARRDLTVNAMAWPISSSRPALVDPLGGLADLEQGVARFVSEKNVLDDPLRMLRLFRFIAGLTLTPDPESLDMVQRHAEKIGGMAGERIREELLNLLGADQAHPVVTLMIETGLWFEIFPEMIPLKGCEQGEHHDLDALDHTLDALRGLEDWLKEPEKGFPRWEDRILESLEAKNRRSLMKLAVLFHDLGKPETRSVDDQGKVRFFGHPQEGEAMVGRIASRLRMSGEETRILRFIVRNHMNPIHLFAAHLEGTLTDKGIFRFHRQAGDLLWALVFQALADMGATRSRDDILNGKDSFLKFLRMVLEKILAQRDLIMPGSRLITGRDLVEELGLPESPLIGKILSAVEEAQALGRVRTRSQALGLARDLAGSARD